MQDDIENPKLPIPKKEEELVLSVPKQTVVNPPDTVEGSLTSAQDEEEKKKQSVLIQSQDMEKILSAYKAFCKKKGYDDKDLPAPDKDGKVSLDFKSPEDMTDFFKERADAKDRFVMIDAETKKVLAYSNGDGKLYRPGIGKDGVPEEITGKSLLPTAEQMKGLPDHEGFKMPEPSSEPAVRLDK